MRLFQYYRCLFQVLQLQRQLIRFSFLELGHFEQKVSRLEAVQDCVQKEILERLPTAVERKSLFLLCCSSKQRIATINIKMKKLYFNFKRSRFP